MTPEIPIEAMVERGTAPETCSDTLEAFINRHSLENASNTPDFILAQFLQSCLDALNTAVQQRETWYGRDASPSCDLEDNK